MNQPLLTEEKHGESLSALVFVFGYTIIANIFLLIGMSDIIPILNTGELAFDNLQEAYLGIFQTILVSLDID